MTETLGSGGFVSQLLKNIFLAIGEIVVRLVPFIISTIV
jgi:hypothetical protein